MLYVFLGAFFAAAYFRPESIAWVSPALTVVLLLLGALWLLAVLVAGLDRLSRWFWALTPWPRTD